MQQNTKEHIHLIQNRMLYFPKNEDGFLLVLTMFVLLVLTLIGISATNLTEVELQIAGNDRIHKTTFYQADGGTELGMRLAYDNAVCVQVNSGFDASAGTSRTIGNIIVSDLDFSSPQTLASTVVSNANRAVAYYPDGVLNDTSTHTNILFNVSTTPTPGSGMQMVSGYEGLAAGAAGGGTHSEFDIYSQHLGLQNSESIITIGWNLSTHIINSASTSDCKAVYRN